MNKYMVQCTFKEGTDMSEVFAVVADEQARVAVLVSENKVGPIHLSLEKKTVFIEAFGASTNDVLENVKTLPMSRWWDINVFPLNPPTH